MTQSVICVLVKKDLLIHRWPIAIYFTLSFVAAGVVSLLIGRVPHWVLFNLGFLLVILPMGVGGMHVLMNTIVHEKLKAVQPFIMSLPVTVREFTWAKMLVNVPVFTVLWLTASATCLWFAFGAGLLPGGMLPFITMVLLGIFLSHISILSVGLLFQSLGATIFCSTFFQAGTAVYLIAISRTVDAVSIQMNTTTADWNTTVIAILAGQVLLSIAVLWGTLVLQLRKQDFL